MTAAKKTHGTSTTAHPPLTKGQTRFAVFFSTVVGTYPGAAVLSNTGSPLYGIAAWAGATGILFYLLTRQPRA